MNKIKSPKTFVYLPTTLLDKCLDLEQTKSDIKQFAFDKNLQNITFVEEKIFKKRVKDTLLPDTLEKLSSGDNLIISKLSHLGRSTLEIFEFLSLVAKKKVNFYCIESSWHFDNRHTIATLSTASSLVIQVEKEVCSVHTKEALRAKQLAGAKLGRPRKSILDPYAQQIENMLAQGVPHIEIIRKYGISKGTFYYWLKKGKISYRKAGRWKKNLPETDSEIPKGTKDG